MDMPGNRSRPSVAIRQNRAVWIHEKGDKLCVGPSEIVEPDQGEILVKNHAWGINPIDWKIQSFGIMLDKYPTVLGFDVAGEVVAVGKAVEKFAVGDRIIAHPLGLQTKRTAEDGFQLYTIVQVHAAAKLPTSLSFVEGAKLPLGILTATAALYNSEHLQLPFPSRSPEPTGKTILVWGGSSNVGNAAIQLAVASGLQVVAVASRKHWDLVRAAGVAAVFDRNDPNVVSDLVRHLQGRDVAGAFNAIGSADATANTAQVIARLGGGKLRSVFNRFTDIDVTVEAKQVQAVSVFLDESEVGIAVWEGFMPGALARGRVKPLLKTVVAGMGLESIQMGIDMVKAGVSGTKVVVIA